MYKGKAKAILKGIRVGDRIQVKKGKKSFEGLLMPRSELGDENHIVLKLDNGYNIGIEITDIKVNKLEEKIKKKEPRVAEVKVDKAKPSITLIGTGGTIASKIDYNTGAVHPAFSAEELINALPELADIASMKTKILFNILSENMQPKFWKRIARECARELNAGAEGVVIAHGTDTLGYTSAALSFMLKNLYKPVVLVGSQRSSDRPSSDSSLNLISAVKVACSDIGEVVVVMHGSTNDDYCLIHRGTRVRKMHSSRRDAFRSVNVLPIGEVRVRVKAFQAYRKRREEEVVVDDKLEEKVALVKTYPGISENFLDYIVDNYKGVVIEGTGLGHVPVELLKPIQRACKEGKPVVMTSQTLYGRVDMKVYSTGRELLARGVISGKDMLPEVAYVKLMHVLGHVEDYAEVKRLMETNLAGEISERTRIDSFLAA